jgi:hypothetical protein
MASRRDQENWQEDRLMISLTTESDFARAKPERIRVRAETQRLDLVEGRLINVHGIPLRSDC